MTSLSAEPHPRATSWRPALLGVVVAAPFVAGLHLFRDGTVDLLAFLLALTGGVYVGAALADGRRSRMAAEAAVAFALFVCAALTLWWASLWAAWGFLAHGAWDLFHHRGTPGLRVRPWFPPFCLAFDWTVALAVLLLR